MNVLLYGCGIRIASILESLRDIVDKVHITDANVATKRNIAKSDQILFINRDQIYSNDYDYVLVTAKRYFDEIKDELLKKDFISEKIVLLETFNKEMIRKVKTDYFCNICNQQVYGWFLTGEKSELFEQKKVIGAGLRKGLCPICGSSDRLRYEYGILKKHTDIFKKKSHILHFAAEKQFIDLLENNGNHYITADITPGRADVFADITNLQFEDESFDWVICNHIIEHVKSEAKAFSEIKRCLKTNGTLVLTVPICWNESTYEGDNITSEIKKKKYYGQSDHERLYGYDIVERITKYGLQVQLYKNSNFMELENCKRSGYIYGDSILLCTKKLFNPYRLN